MKKKSRQKDNYETVRELFNSIDDVLNKTECFSHLLDYGEKNGENPSDTTAYHEIEEVIANFNEIFIRNRNKLSEKLGKIIEKIE